MNWKILRQFVAVFLTVVLFAAPAHANAGVPPLFFMSWGAMVLALAPIIVIEMIVLWVRGETSFWEAGLAASVANLASTFIGIPVALILHANFRKIVGETPKGLQTLWQRFRMVVAHVQYVDVNDPETRIPVWMWPGGWLVLMVPFFLASWLSEVWITRILLGAYPATGLDKAVFEANLVTYGLLVALLSALLVLAIRHPSVEDASNADLEPDSEPDVLWRVANSRARRGMARLRMAETMIDRQRLIRAAADAQRSEDADIRNAA